MAEVVYISTSGVRFSLNKFDSDNLYLRAGAAGSSFPMVQGRTIVVDMGQYSTSSTINLADWKFDSTVSSYTNESISSVSAFTATATTVTTTD